MEQMQRSLQGYKKATHLLFFINQESGVILRPLAQCHSSFVQPWDAWNQMVSALLVGHFRPNNLKLIHLPLT